MELSPPSQSQPETKASDGTEPVERDFNPQGERPRSGWARDSKTGRLVDPDIRRRFAEWKWRSILQEVEHKRHPSDSELAELIERFGVPPIAAAYVNGRTSGTDGPKRGRPPEPPSPRWQRAASLACNVIALQAAFRIQGFKDHKQRALAVVAGRKQISKAGRRKISKSRLWDIISCDLQDAPYRLTSSHHLDEMEEWVRELVRNGTVWLDRSRGIVWESDPKARSDVQRFHAEKARSDARRKQ